MNRMAVSFYLVPAAGFSGRPFFADSHDWRSYRRHNPKLDRSHQANAVPATATSLVPRGPQPRKSFGRYRVFVTSGHYLAGLSFGEASVSLCRRTTALAV